MASVEPNILLAAALGTLLLIVLIIIWLKRRRLAQSQLLVLRSADAALPTDEYLPRSIVEEWQSNHAEALSIARSSNLSRFLPKKTRTIYDTHHRNFRDVSSFVRRLNEAFISRRLDEDAAAFDQIEKFPLTQRQRQAIVVDENNAFVVAGAGTGKTSTIVAKTDYLTRHDLAKPYEVLVLAFGNKAAEELRQRFSDFPSASGVTASTFHSLGLGIIGQVNGKRPTLSVYATDDHALEKFISNQLFEQLSDSDFAGNLIRLFSDLMDEQEEDAAKHNYASEMQRLRTLGLRDLTDTKMKSRQEVAIANWLTLHGIKWQYERPYEHPTATPWKRDYLPDFYLTDYGIYLEHFGVDRQNQTADHVDTDAYIAAMNWKRNLHQQRETTLIETYSWMFSERTWSQELSRQLRLHDVAIRSIRPDEAQNLIDNSSKPLTDFVKLISQFLSLYKSGNHTPAQLRTAAETERDNVFLDVFFRLYDAYEEELKALGQIDFNDMINLARSMVQTGQYQSPYRYIIVDEFQDISANRLGLIQDLRNQHQHSRVFVVGDDWQSIYRFAGSDIGIATNFEEYVGFTERIDLDVAFRYPQPLLDVTSQFVMRNPAQLKKVLRAHATDSTDFPLCIVFDEGRDSSQPVSTALAMVLKEITAQPTNNPSDESRTVMMIGRYHFNRPENFSELQRQFAEHNLDLTYSTAHGSKGKEADFVIIVGLEAGEYGFPSNVSDDHVMRMVLTNEDEFPYGEERRLFYVAMTRTRTRTYLVVPHDNVSPFVSDDLMGEELAEFVEIIGEVSARHRCPRCKERTIKRREGNYGTWWACTNWPICLGRLRTCTECKEGALIELDAGGRCTHCGHEEVRCPRCHEGLLVSRTNRSSGQQFWACSTWGGGAGCLYTQNHRPYLPEAAAKQLRELEQVAR